MFQQQGYSTSLVGRNTGEDVLNRLARQPDQLQRFMAALRHGKTVANAMRWARPLPPEAEKLIDDAIIRVGRDRLAIGPALVDAGLTRPLPNWMAVQILEQRRLNDFGVVHETMVLRSPNEGSMGDESSAFTPIFARTAGTYWGVRELMVAERSGMSLDTEAIEQYTRRMNEAWEDQSINGSTLNVKTYTAPGFANAPNVNTFTFENNRAWDAAAKTGQGVKDDLISAAEALRDNNFDGPYGCIINDTYELALMDDYYSSASGSDASIMEVVSRMFGGITFIVSNLVPADTIYFFQMSTDVVDVIVGDYPTATTWSDTPGLVTNVLLISCLITRTKDNYDGLSGIVIGTPT